MPKLIKIVETNLTKQMKLQNYKRVYYTNTVLVYEKEIEPNFIISISIASRGDTAHILFSSFHNLITKKTYLIHFNGSLVPEIDKIYQDKKKNRPSGFIENVFISDSWLNVHKEEELTELPLICELGLKQLEKDFGTIQKTLETYESGKYPDYTYQDESGWRYFGFLNAIYGDKKRAVELLEKFGNTDFSYEYMGEKKHSKYDVIRQKYVKIAVENIENKEKILELIKDMNIELERINL